MAEQDNEDQARAQQLRIASKSRKIGMLISASHSPQEKAKIRKDFLRREKLQKMKEAIRERRSLNRT